MRCIPWMNWVLIGSTVLCSAVFGFAENLTPFGERLVLGHGPLGLVGHVLIHADYVHLFGNMLFLWVFGNAVCAKVGNLLFPFLYFGLGFVAGVVAYAIDPRPAVGASGAINGIVGMYVVWYLLNDVSFWYGFWFVEVGRAGFCSVSSFWIILLWAGFDIWGALHGKGNVGHVAHLAGLIAGFTLAIVMLKQGWIEMERGERSLFEVLSGSDEPPRRRRKHRIT